jgi:hypothetical protein
MKNLLLLSSFLVLLESFGQTNSKYPNYNLSIDMDPRTELLSVVSYLAGYKEYSMCRISDYKNDVDRYFSRFNEHEAVQFARKLRKNNSVGYDAPMIFAVHLTDSITPLISFDSCPFSMDKRFRAEDLQEYVKLLNAFAKETNFNSFFMNEKLKYDGLVQKYRDLIYSRVNFSWINPFLNLKEAKNYKIIIDLMNGSQNYGPSININGDEKFYSILGVSPIPSTIPQSKMDGLIIFEGVIVHEFGHSYLNKVVGNNEERIRGVGERLLKLYQARNPMRQYNDWGVVMKETLVRSFVICYMKENRGDSGVNQLVEFDNRQGFYWTKEIAEIMLSSHEKKSVEEMFPEIISFLDKYCSEHI